MLDISAFNAFVIWMALNPEWNRGKLQKRRLFLEDLGKALVRPQIEQRQHVPRTPASAAIVRRIQEENAGALSTQPTEPQSTKAEVVNTSNKKKRCEVCGPKMDRKTQYMCINCKKVDTPTESTLVRRKRARGRLAALFSPFQKRASSAFERANELVLDAFQRLGVETLQDLNYVQEADLLSVLRPTEARKLIARVKALLFDKTSPPVSELKERWPALFYETQLYCEFHRITNQHLPHVFYAALDEYAGQLIGLYKKKKTVGEKMNQLLLAYEKQDKNDIHVRRTAALAGLPIYLKEDSSGIFTTCKV
ncbi:hypothetical protein MHYP_G00306580 [Metynnis hypsauchen]